MLKRYLSLLLTVLIILSCVTMPCAAANAELALETLAYDTFSFDEGYRQKLDDDTTSTVDKNIINAYAKDENGNDKIPGYGWSTNWVVANSTGDGYIAPADTDNIKFMRDTTHSSKYYNHLLAKPLSTKVYRFLENPITFAGKDGKYIFSVDISLCVSNNFNGIRYYIGDAFYIGFEGAVSENSDNTGTVTPLIGVNGEEFKSDISLLTGSAHSAREFVTYTVTVELNADGEDTITLSAVDGENVPNAPYESDKVATVSTTAELSGTCEYIAFESADSNNQASVCLYGFNISGSSYSATPEYEAYPVIPIAEETIALSDYAKGKSSNDDTTGINNANIVGAYTDASVATGTGWNGNWLVKDADDTDYRAPEDTDKVFYNRPSNTVGELIFLSGMPAETNLYRFLESPIDFDGTEGKYVFSADIQNGFSSSKSNFRYNIGNLISVGYDYVADTKTDGKLIIEVGDKTYTASGNIELGPETTDATNNYYMHFDVEVYLKKDSADIIKVNVTQKTNNNQTIAAAEPVIFMAAADLNGSVEYIGFGSIEGATAQYRIDNIKVGGYTPALFEEYEAYPVIPIAEETIALSDYANGKSSNDDTTGINNANIVGAYTDASVATGTGWNGNWLVKDEDDADYRAPEDTDKVFYNRPSNTIGELIFLSGMPAETNLYRFLKTPIDFDGTDGKYVFSADIQNGLSSTKSNFRYNIGNLISVGYDYVADTKTDGKLIIEVGDKTYTASGNIELGPETTDATNNYYMHFDVEVYLKKDSTDIIKVNVTKKSSSNGTIAAEEPVTFMAAADLDGSVEYIGFGSIDGAKAQYRIDNIKVGGFSSSMLEDGDAYPVVDIAEETIALSDYAKGKSSNEDTTGINNANIVGAYTDASVATGTGWNGNWLVKDADDTDYRAPEDTDKVFYNRPSNTIGELIFLSGMPAETNLYRFLKTPIDFDGTDGKYVFSADIQNGLSSIKSNLRFKIGENLSVGYNAASATEGTLVIEVGDKTYTASGNIELGPETTDATNNYYMHFDVEVYLKKDSTDIIKVNVTQKTNNNQTIAAAEPVTFMAAADLNGSVEYIGFGSIDGAKAQYRIDNIKVGGFSSSMLEDGDAYPVVDIAEEEFSEDEYTKTSSNENVADVYIKPDTATGTGWDGNWVVKDSDDVNYRAPENADNVKYYSSIGGMIKLDGMPVGTNLYRVLEKPVNFNGIDGKYTFSVDAQNGTRNEYASSRTPFRYNIGGLFSVGYDIAAVDTDGDVSTYEEYHGKPVIEINGTVVAESDSTIVIGTDSADGNPFYHIDAEVYLQSEGADIIKLSVYNRSNKADIITLYAAADLDGIVKYVAFGSTNTSKSSYRIDNIYVKGIDDANLPTEDDPTEDTFLYATDLSMSEEFLTTQYGTGWDTKVGTVYNSLDANGFTGTGWGSNWLMKDAEGAYVAVDDEAATTYPTDGNSAANGVGIRYYNHDEDSTADDDAAAALYRKLGTPVSFDNKDGKYIFGLDFKTYGNTFADFKYVINENVTVGYEFNADNEAVPYITVGETTVNAKNSIAVKGGNTTTTLSKFKVIVELNQKGADKITVRLSTDGMNAYATTTADLTGNCEYIGIDGASIFYDNVYITGSNYTKAKRFTRTAHTLSYKDADGQTQNVASISEIPADIRNISVYVQYKNGGMVDYEDDGVTPKTNCAVMMLTGFYYDGKLVMVKRAGDQVIAGQSTHTTRDFTISSDNGWVELDEFDWSKVTIKSYLFGFETFEPLCEAGIFEGTTADAAEPMIMYVNANAADGGNGSAEEPYNSINAAKFAVRTLNRNNVYPEDGVVIKLEGDFYTKDFVDSSHPEEYLWLQSGYDYGKAGAPLVFDGENKARIIGGIKLDLASDFVATEAGDTINNSNVVKYVAPKGSLTADLPVKGSSAASIDGVSTTPYFQVIFNNKSMTLARWPNGEFDEVSKVSSVGTAATNDGFEFTSRRIESEGKLAQWKDDNIAVHGYWNVDYHDFGTPATVTANGLKGNYAPESGKGLLANPGVNRRFYVENSPEDLDTAGEWYIESTDTNDILYFWPTEATGEVIIGTTTAPIIKGDSSNYVTIKNLGIVGGRSSGIKMDGTKVTISGCTVNGVAGTGIDIEGALNSVIEKCEVYDVGSNGIIIGGGTRRQDDDTTPCKGNTVVKNNKIHDFAKVIFCYSYGVQIGGYDNTVRNNEIYNAPGVAVTMTGWDLVFKNNKVHDVLKEASDMGAIYVGKSKARRGGQILNNHFYDLETSSKLDGSVDISAIFMDDISDGYTVKGNIFENIHGRAFRTNGGRDHTVTGNVFVNVRTNAGFKSVYGNQTQLGYIIDDKIMTGEFKLNGIKTVGMYKLFTEYPHLADLVVPTENTAETAKAEIMWPMYNIFKDNYTYDDKYGSEKVDFKLIGDYPTDDYDSIDAFMTSAECKSEYVGSTTINAITNNDYSAYGINYANIGIKD